MEKSKGKGNALSDVMVFGIMPAVQTHNGRIRPLTWRAKVGLGESSLDALCARRGVISTCWLPEMMITYVLQDPT